MTKQLTNYMNDEPTLLAVAEVPKCQPKLQATQSLLYCGPEREPPCSNGKILSFGFRR
jgi:hypothetical protein